MDHPNADSTAEVLPEIREGSLGGLILHLGWHGWAMLLRFALDAAACALLLAAVGPAVPLLVAAPLPVLIVSSQKLSPEVFFVVALLRTLLSDYVGYRLGDHSVKYRVVGSSCERKLLKWPLWAIGKVTWPLRWLARQLSRVLMNANHWLVLLVLFLLRLFAVPGTSVANPYVLAGARGMPIRQLAIVNILATAGCLVLLGQAFTSWL